MNNHVAIDAETTYSKTRDIKTLGPIAYLRHPDTDIYLVSMYGEGIEWVGHPKDAPWPMILGRPWVSHNRSFDSAVYEELIRRGVAPEKRPPQWHCSSDMAAFLQVKRDLATSAKVLLKVYLDKGIRNKMKGQTWETMTPEFREDAKGYALDDSRACWLLWSDFSDQFPEFERRLSEHTSLMCNRGVAVDVGLAQSNISWLQPALELVLREIPWVGEFDEKGKAIPIGSIKRLRKECESRDVPMPGSTDVKSEQFQDWVDEWADKAPFVAAIQQYRRVTRYLNLSQGLINRSVEGRFRYGLKYGGACHTMRWAGDLGWNIQNPPKVPYAAMELAVHLRPDLSDDEQRAWLSAAGVDPDSKAEIRRCLVAGLGKKLVTADLSQIEPRCLAYLAGQGRVLELARSGIDWYEAQARAMGLYQESEPLKVRNPALRQTVKVLNLGLGYGLGEAGLMRSYRRNIGKIMEAAEAVRLVALYRDSNPEVTDREHGLWAKLNKTLRVGLRTDRKVALELPSGRTIRYFDLRNDPEEGPLCVVERGSPHKKMWHGRATENCLAEGTPVLTQRGWVPIEDVAQNDLLWDGVEWVRHEGVIDKGTHRTIDCHGVRCTEDHLFLTREGWTPALLACNLEQEMLSSAHAETVAGHRPLWKEIRTPDRPAVRRIRRTTCIVGSPMRLRNSRGSTRVRNGAKAPNGEPVLRGGLPRRRIHTAQEAQHSRHVQTPCLRGVGVYEGEVWEPRPPGLQELRGTWDPRVREMARLVPGLLGRHGADLLEWGRPGQNRQRAGISAGKLPMGYPLGEPAKHEGLPPKPFRGSPRLFGDRGRKRCETHHPLLPTEPRMELGESLDTAPVYDILDAGPRHRFTILGDLPVIVHNCVQGLARDGFAPKILTLEQDGLPVVMHSHDELTCEVDADRAEEAKQHVIEVMARSPEWAPELPMASEAHVYDRYEKK